MLTFLEPTEKRSGKNIVWKLLCECGNVCYATVSNVHDQKGKHGKKSCGCTRAADLSRAGAACRKFDPRISSARLVWRRTYKDATWETFLSLSQLPCHYCGHPPRKTWNKSNAGGQCKTFSDYQKRNGDFTYNGLDRIDSAKGHTDDNVIPCCYICNSMKSDMPYEEFRAHIKLLSSREWVAIPPLLEKRGA